MDDVQANNEPARAASAPKSSKDIQRFLSVGMPIIFDRNISRPGSARLDSILVGWKSGQYLILEFRNAERMHALILGENKCALRFIHEGRPCAMLVNTRDSVVERKAGLFCATWPTEVVYKTVRSSERFAVRVVCEARLANDSTITGDTRNLSLDGCRIVLSESVEVGAELLCSFQLPNGSKFDAIPCIVCKTQSVGMGCEVGCRFHDMKESDSKNLQFYLSIVEASTDEEGPLRDRVLIIDAQGPHLAAICSGLRETGLDAMVLTDIVQAFTWLGIRRTHCVLINADLPHVSASSLCTMIRENHTADDIPVYVYGGSGEAVAKEVEEAGATRYIPTLEDSEAILQLLKNG